MSQDRWSTALLLPALLLAALPLAIDCAHAGEPWLRAPGLEIRSAQRGPAYPEAAMRAGVEGRVALAYSIDASGRPVSISMLASDEPMLETAAVQLLESLRYVVPKDWADKGNAWTRYNMLVVFVLDDHEPRPAWIPGSAQMVIRVER